MSTTSNSATTTLYVNGKPAQDELARLRAEVDKYKKQLMDIAADPSKGLGSTAWSNTLKKVKATEKELDKMLNFIVEGKGKNAHAIAPSTLLLFGGGLALGGLMYTTGLSDWIGHGIKDILGGHPSEFLFVSLFCAAALLLAEFTSHTAAINLMGTIAIGTALSLGFSPIPVAVGIALASSLGFMMPVSTPPNAIVYASGYVPITKMIKSGAIIDIIGVFCITIPIVLLLVKAVMGV